MNALAPTFQAISSFIELLVNFSSSVECTHILISIGVLLP